MLCFVRIICSSTGGHNIDAISLFNITNAQDLQDCMSYENSIAMETAYSKQINSNLHVSLTPTDEIQQPYVP